MDNGQYSRYTSHEIGHRLVHNLGLGTEIDDYEKEAYADYIAGLTVRLCKLDPTDKLSWYSSGLDFNGIFGI